LAPYTSWFDFVLHLKHPESLVNFVAAYGTHPTVTGATTLADKRAAATLLVLGGAGAPADRLDFMNSTGAWASGPDGVTITGLDAVDFWVGGLAGLGLGIVAFIIVAGLAARVRQRWPEPLARVLKVVPPLLVAGIVVGSVYAYFFRQPSGRLAVHDAYALRMYAWYVGVAGLWAAIAGFVLVTWRRFWKDPVLLSTTALIAAFFFYKVRIVPEHFWQVRRFLPLVLPMTTVLSAAAALWAFETWRVTSRHRTSRLAVAGVGLRYLALPLAFLLFLGWQYALASRAIQSHVEYAGLIPQLEKLASRFGDRDLRVESCAQP
jgi:hypothetical protein